MNDMVMVGDLSVVDPEVASPDVSAYGPARLLRVSRDDLLDAVCGYESIPFTRTVDTHVAKLRKKIEADPAHPAPGCRRGPPRSRSGSCQAGACRRWSSAKPETRRRP